MLTDDFLFTTSGLAHMHDAVLNGSGLSIPDERLKVLFGKLPPQVQDDARRWGLNDTPVRDAMCLWASENTVLVAVHVK